MERFARTLIVGASLASSGALAAEIAVKPPPAAAASSPWDLAFTGAVMSDYIFRGITQSNHQPSVQAGVEPRYNFSKTLQAYLGVSGESIDFPNRAAAEIDFYGGIRPTVGIVAFDFGVWYYYYPDGQCFNSAALCANLGGAPSTAPALPNGDVVKENLSFYEGYGKATVTVNDNFNFGAQIWGSRSVLNSGASGIYYAGNVTLTAPSTWFTYGIGAYASADIGWWQLGTTDAFYAVPAFPAGVSYASYLNWDAGIGITWKIFTLDLRYYDTNLTKAQCNVFTSDQTATFSPAFITAQNPVGLGSNWCGAAFVAKLSISTTLAAIK